VSLGLHRLPIAVRSLQVCLRRAQPPVCLQHVLRLCKLAPNPSQFLLSGLHVRLQW